jgi:7-carboxy-7-deazaguanine synthase
MASLRITEIFLSLQGESRTVGLPTVFVRLTGCPLRCTWCDTEYAFTGGKKRDIDGILAEVRQFGVTHVTVTGGEPLAQPDCLELLRRLCDDGLRVSLETSGALDIAAVDPRVDRVMDLKAPSSGETAHNRLANLACLGARDQLKFVVADHADYVWSRAMIAEHSLAGRCELLMQPVHGRVEPAELAQWILDDRLPVRFQLQLHKLLWGDAHGR